nr:MAG TPA: hypothetical protein [Caudoviricetes sp.]
MQLALFDEIEVIQLSPEHEQVDSWIDFKRLSKEWQKIKRAY